jgi:hypothetical protein
MSTTPQFTGRETMILNGYVAETSAPTAFETFQRKGYGLKPVIIGTLLIGMYLHATAIFLGVPLMIKHLVTPAFDMLFAIPITYGALAGWLNWNRVVHRSGWHTFAYGFLTVYFTASVPIHLRTYFTHNTDVLLAFPSWYSAALLPVLVALAVFTWRLQFKADVIEEGTR